MNDPTRRQLARPVQDKKKQMALRILRVFAVVLIGVLAALSWLPAQSIVRTGMAGQLEHLIAYAGTTIVVGVAFHRLLPLGVQCGLLILFAGILEVGQMYAPGRHSSVVDFAFSAAGTILGGIGIALALRIFTKWPRET